MNGQHTITRQQFTLKLPSEDIGNFESFRQQCKDKGERVNQAILRIIKAELSQEGHEETAQGTLAETHRVGLTGVQQTLASIEDKLDRLQAQLRPGEGVVPARPSGLHRRFEALDEEVQTLTKRLHRLEDGLKNYQETLDTFRDEVVTRLDEWSYSRVSTRAEAYRLPPPTSTSSAGKPLAYSQSHKKETPAALRWILGWFKRSAS